MRNFALPYYSPVSNKRGGWNSRGGWGGRLLEAREYSFTKDIFANQCPKKKFFANERFRLHFAEFNSWDKFAFKMFFPGKRYTTPFCLQLVQNIYLLLISPSFFPFGN